MLFDSNEIFTFLSPNLSCIPLVEYLLFIEQRCQRTVFGERKAVLGGQILEIREDKIARFGRGVVVPTVVAIGGQ